jgi:hypothetical protein
VTIPLAHEVRLFSDLANSTYKDLDLEPPELAGLLPHAESIQLEWLLDQVTNDQIAWNIEAFPGWDRNNEGPMVLFFGTDQSAAGPQLATITNFTSASYRRHVRLALKWRLFSGTVAKEARFSAVLYVTTKGS